MKKSIFRDYDIRGLSGTDITAPDVQCIGFSFAQKVKKAGFDAIAVGMDVRESSKEFLMALIEGVTQAGVNVKNLSLVTTPMLYHFAISENIQNAVMVTASHNPKEFNGLKFLFNGKPFFGQDLLDLYSANNKFTAAPNSGNNETTSYKSKYLDALMSKFDFSQAKHSPKIIIDACSGSVCTLIKTITSKLPGDFHIINGEPDGSFPSHTPDPSSIENLSSLYSRVVSDGYDLGFAFDCDGDRIAVLDKSGSLLRGDQIAFLFAKYGKYKQGSNIVIDVRSSCKILTELEVLGFKPIISETGNPYVKEHMLSNKAPLGAELSGHIMFADWLNIDDALFAMLKFLEIIYKHGIAALKSIPPLYRSNDIKIECKNIDKNEFLEKIKDYLLTCKAQNFDILTIDGVKIKNEAGSISFRTSNTEEILSVVVEGNSNGELVALKKEANQIFEALNLEIFIA